MWQTLVPVFVEDERTSQDYIRSGNFQVPLFSGQVPMDLLNHLRSHPSVDVEQLVASWCAGPKGGDRAKYGNDWFKGASIDDKLYPQLIPEASSVFVRIVDEQLGPEFILPMTNMNPYFLPEGPLRNKYLRKNDGVEIRTIVPQGMNDIDFLDAMNQSISRITGITHDV